MTAIALGLHSTLELTDEESDRICAANRDLTIPHPPMPTPKIGKLWVEIAMLEIHLKKR
jgi:hypothetical protein